MSYMTILEPTPDMQREESPCILRSASSILTVCLNKPYHYTFIHEPLTSA